MAPLRMLYIVTLTYIFKVAKFEMVISGNTELGTKCYCKTFMEVDIRHRMRRANVAGLLRNFHQHFRGQMFKTLTSPKR